MKTSSLARWFVPGLVLLAAHFLSACSTEPVVTDQKCMDNLDAVTAKRRKAEESNPKAMKLKDEGLTKEQVRSKVGEKIPEIRTCFTKHAKKEGDFMVSFLIGPAGKVDLACMKESNFEEAAFQNCVVSSIKAIRFPAPSAGVSVKIDYPFAFDTN